MPTALPVESIQIRHNGPNNHQFTICVLLYGDEGPYAERCLSSIAKLPDYSRIELRIGMNAVSDTVREHVGYFVDAKQKRGLNVLLYNSHTNRGKYPIMRWMFHDPINPITSPYIMWFDDDSFIREPTDAWLNKLSGVMSKADICGEVMHTQLTGNQHLWIQMQPWYNGLQPVRDNQGHYNVQAFVVGGWWTVRTKAIQMLNWPTPSIHHRGGDYMLGEAFRQHGFKIVQFAEGVGINCTMDDKAHKARRRGLDPVPVGIEYTPSLTERLHFATKEIDPRLLDYPGL